MMFDLEGKIDPTDPTLRRKVLLVRLSGALCHTV